MRIRCMSRSVQFKLLVITHHLHPHYTNNTDAALCIPIPPPDRSKYRLPPCLTSARQFKRVISNFEPRGAVAETEGTHDRTIRHSKRDVSPLHLYMFVVLSHREDNANTLSPPIPGSQQPPTFPSPMTSSFTSRPQPLHPST